MGRERGKLPERPPEYTNEPAQPYWPTFIEKLLLAIIDANPPDDRPAAVRASDKDRQRRLEQALEGLFRVSAARGPKKNYALHAAVAAARSHAPAAAMAAFETQVLNAQKRDRTRGPSLRSAARQNADLIAGNSEPARLDRIEDFEATHREYLSQVALFGFLAEEEDMQRDLEAVARIFGQWNIPLVIDPEALGMASLWGANCPQLTPESDG